MTKAELTDETFNLPRPGASRIDNLIATLLLQKNRSKWLNLDRIASFQGFDPSEFSARFAHLETAYEQHLTLKSLQPDNQYETPEGK